MHYHGRMSKLEEEKVKLQVRELVAQGGMNSVSFGTKVVLFYSSIEIQIYSTLNSGRFENQG